jgi:hypothetical protein
LRKSPIKHHVRSHKRCGRPVIDYERGHGSRPAKPSIRRTAQSPSSFMVYISYASQPPETFPVNADDYAQAIEFAMISRKSITPPLEVEAAKR